MKIARLMRRPRIVRAGIVLCAAMAAIPAQAAKPSIGVTSLVVQHVEGTSEQRTRRLALRDPVHQDEVVVTGEQSASEMHLVDDTRVTVGPNSKVVLDRFVYDPDPGKGALVLQATEGVFRFFSGNMASSNYAIETPSVTVGIRGTIFVGAIRPSDGTFALILESRSSEVSVTGPSGETVVLSAPGQAAIARADGSVTSGRVPDWAVAMVERMDGIIVKASTDDSLSGPDRDVDVAGLTDRAPARAPTDDGKNGRNPEIDDGGARDGGTGDDDSHGDDGDGHGDDDDDHGDDGDDHGDDDGDDDDDHDDDHGDDDDHGSGNGKGHDQDKGKGHDKGKGKGHDD